MKIVYNIYVAVRKLWNAIFGKNGDGSQLVIPGRISGASGDVTVGEGLELTNNTLTTDNSAIPGRISGATGSVTVGGALNLTDNQLTATKIYWHTVKFERKVPDGGYDLGFMIILTNSADAITVDTFVNLLKTSGFLGVVINGITSGDESLLNPPTGADYPLYAIENGGTNSYYVYYYDASTYTIKKTIYSRTASPNWFTVTDLGVNAIN